MNVYLLFYLLVLLVIAAVFTGLKFKWENDNPTGDKTWYLAPANEVVRSFFILNLLHSLSFYCILLKQMRLYD